MDNMNGIINFNKIGQTIEVGSKTTFLQLCQFTLKHDLIPPVVPELSTITVGGAFSGVAIESGSFKYGLFHENVLEIQLLNGLGRILRLSSANPLFRSIPNSYGTLGYVTSLKLKLIPASSHVFVSSTRFRSVQEACKRLQSIVKSPNVNFCEGITFGNDKTWIITSRFISPEKYKTVYPLFQLDKPFHQIAIEQEGFVMSTHDYLWRWDFDMFWGTQHLPKLCQQSWFRKFFGRPFFNTRCLKGLSQYVSNFKPKPKSNSNIVSERLIQDIGIPIEYCSQFIEKVISLTLLKPVWICPVISHSITPHFQLEKGRLYCDIAFFGSSPSRSQGTLNRILEILMFSFGGLKCFYSDSYISRDEFARYYDAEQYSKMKNLSDPHSVFPHVFDKCISTVEAKKPLFQKKNE